MINVDLFNFINHNLQNPFLDWIMIFTTHLGGFVSLCAILVLIIILSTIFKKKNIRNIAALCLVALQQFLYRQKQVFSKKSS